MNGNVWNDIDGNQIVLFCNIETMYLNDILMGSKSLYDLRLQLCAFIIIENEWLAVHHAALYDGVLNTLKTLSAKMPLFIVSNCQGGYIEVMKETTGLTPYITDHLCPDDTVHAKASNIRAIVEKHNLKSPIYVGDTQGDLNASREAGVKFVFASYGFGQVDSYDGVIEKPEDLLTLSETEI